MTKRIDSYSPCRERFNAKSITKDNRRDHRSVREAPNYPTCSELYAYVHKNNRNFFIITKGKDGQLRFTFFVSLSEKKNTMSSVTSRKLVGRRRTE